MAGLADAEIYLQLYDEKNYKSYLEFSEVLRKEGKEEYLNQIRYAMALSYTFQERDQLEGIMFIGSLGVLGNLVQELGNEAILVARGTGDIDVVVQSRGHASSIDSMFDCVTDAHMSHSIPNKMTVQGYSVDSDENPLSPTTIDAYILNKKDDELLNMKTFGTYLHEGVWDSRVKADFFGISIPCAPPLTLLEMKLHVCCSNGKPRKQDCQDIRNLLGLLEKKGFGSDYLRNYLSYMKQNRLKSLISDCPCEEKKCNFVIDSSEKFRRPLLV